MAHRFLGLSATGLLVASGALARDARVVAPREDTATISAAPSAPSAPGHFVRDANQQYVGTIFDARWVARSVDGEWVLFAAGVHGPAELDDRIFYATSDCSGQAYIANQADGTFGGFFGFGFWIENTLSYGLPGEAHPVFVQSARDHEGAGLSSCFEFTDANLSRPRAPLRTFTLSSSLSAPFHLAQN